MNLNLSQDPDLIGYQALGTPSRLPLGQKLFCELGGPELEAPSSATDSLCFFLCVHEGRHPGARGILLNILIDPPLRRCRCRCFAWW